MQTRAISKSTLWLLVILIVIPAVWGAKSDMGQFMVKLPDSVGSWTRTETVKRIEKTQIFDYMNGAGEIYLAFGFDHIEVSEYQSESQPRIEVEVYVMETSDDAFGLLSMDWGGDPVLLESSVSGVAPSARALYGAGLLRMCTDNIYSRILATRDTPESRETVLTLGKLISDNRSEIIEPALLGVLPQTIGTGWQIRTDRIGFFRSHLILNSHFYLSHKNILNLNHDVSAVTVPYEKKSSSGKPQRMQVLYIRYPTASQAQTGLSGFVTAYLADKAIVPTQNDNSSDITQIEDGWLGYELRNTDLVIIFQCPDRETTQKCLDAVGRHPVSREEKNGK